MTENTSRPTYLQFPDGLVIRTTSPDIHPEGKRLSATEGKAALKEEALNHLRSLIKPGDTVYCTLRHVSSSGMSRRIRFIVIDKDRKPVVIDGSIADACGYRRHNDGGLVVSGCGMDMGFSVVYELSRMMFPKGFIPAEAGRRGRNGTPATELDTDGGYALNSQWI